jgi:hypothetical protein
MLTNQTYGLVSLEADSGVCRVYIETARSKFPLEKPCSCWVFFVVSIRFPILEASQQNVLWGGVAAPRPTPNMEDIACGLSGIGGSTSS